MYTYIYIYALQILCVYDVGDRVDVDYMYNIYITYIHMHIFAIHRLWG